MTQQELSQILGNTRAHISQIEHYRIKPGTEMALKMWILFGIPLDGFFLPTEIEKMKADVWKQAAQAGYTRPARRKRAA